MEYVFIILGIICTLAGIVGCIIPVLPGPILNLAGVILLELSGKERLFSTTFFITFAVLIALSYVLDLLLPIVSAKRYGASKYGVWGSLIGTVVGLLFFPPLGMIFGIFAGAVIGELLAGKEHSQALKAGIVTFIANIVTMVFKLSISITMAFFFFIKLFTR